MIERQTRDLAMFNRAGGEFQRAGFWSDMA
jgi:hypothetical protein